MKESVDPAGVFCPLLVMTASALKTHTVGLTLRKNFIKNTNILNECKGQLCYSICETKPLNILL